MSDKRVWAVTAMVLCNVFYSGNFFLGGIASKAMPIASLLYVKWGAGVIPLLIASQLIERPDWRIVFGQWKKLALLSLLSIGGYGFMFYYALRTTTPVNASLINAFNPALIALASTIFLGERLGVQKWLGIAVAFAGVCWVVSRGDLNTFLSLQVAQGDLLMVGVILAWTAFTILLYRGVQLPPLAQAAAQMLIFTVVMTPYIIVTGLTLPTTAAGIWSLAYIIIFPAAVAKTFWLFGSKYVEPSTAGQFLNLIVPFTVIITMLTGGTITSYAIFGGFLILFGVYITSRKPRDLAIRAENPTRV